MVGLALVLVALTLQAPPCRRTRRPRRLRATPAGASGPVLYTVDATLPMFWRTFVPGRLRRRRWPSRLGPRVPTVLDHRRDGVGILTSARRGSRTCGRCRPPATWRTRGAGAPQSGHRLLVPVRLLLARAESEVPRVGAADRGRPLRHARDGRLLLCRLAPGCPTFRYVYQGDGSPSFHEMLASAMACPHCQHANRPGARFCEECGTPLPRACGACGAASRPPRSSAPSARTRPARRRRASSARRDLHASIWPSASSRPGPPSKASASTSTVLFADLKARWSSSRIVIRGGRKLLDPVLERMMTPSPLRRDGQPGHGRRHHGALRRAIAQEDHAPRACYAAPDARTVGRYADELRRMHGWTSRSASASLRRTSSWLHRQRPAMDYTRWGQTTTSPREWNSWRGRARR